jgi:hypothetical protein
MIAAINSKSLSEELELESQKVRSMYEIGQSTDWANERLSGLPTSMTIVGEETVNKSEQLVFLSNDLEAIDRV